MPRFGPAAGPRGALHAVTASAAGLCDRLGALIRNVAARESERGLWRVGQLRRYTIAGVLVLSTPLALFGWLWVWALHGVHFPSAVEVTSRRIIVLQTADGQTLFAKDSVQMPPVPVKDMPADVLNAVLSIEDRRFYQHGAVDLLSTLRALRQNFEAGHIVAGGSTITQQLAKMLFLTPQRTYKRKVKEAAIAFWLEHELTKSKILESYLNNVYLGSGAIGFPAAAKVYFGKRVGNLTLQEAAMLAGMIKAPSRDDPFRNLAAARRRAAAVLDAMVANGKLSVEAALVAKLDPATPIVTQISPPSAGWFANWAYQEIANAIPRLAGPVRVRTTLDLRLQQLAAKIVKSTLAAYGQRLHATQAALVAMRPDGAVVAMVGGRNYAESRFNRAVQAKRQPGSAFKLFDYYAALREGFTPDDEVLDEPVDVQGWRPQNYGRSYHGPVTLAEAFAHSFNGATVRLSQEVGIQKVIDAAHDLGLGAPLRNDPSLALGTSELSLLDLTAAYAAVRAGVAPIEPWGIVGVHGPNSGDYAAIGHPDEPRHGLGQYQGELIDLLEDVVKYGTGRAAALPGFAAGKTGTSQDYRDAWFIGFDNSLIVGVWIGNDDHSPMKRVVGGTLPALIWKLFMEGASSPPTTEMQEQLESPNELFDQGPRGPATGRPNAKCNAPACEQHYHSFRASDCTYQPYYGPRRVCGQ